MKSFVKDVASVGLSKGLIIIFGLANSVLIARLLGPSANGIINSLLVYPSLFMTIGSLGIRQATTYFVGQNLYAIEDIKKAIVSIWLFTSLICLGACFALIYFFSSNGDNIIWILLAIAPIPFALFNTYNSGVFLGQNRIGAFNKINWLPIFITLVANVILVWIIGFNIKGALVAILLGNVAISVILMAKDNFFRFLSLSFNFSLIKSMLSLGVVYAIALLVISLNYKLDVILLDKFSSNYEIGIYGKGVSLMEYLWQIPMLLSTIVFARSAAAKDGRLFSIKVAQLLRISIILVTIASIALFFLAPLIIPLLFSESFEGSVSVLRILLPGVVLMTIFKVLNVDLAGKGKPWASLYAMVPALVVNVTLNILFIPEYGANGASLASTISYSLAAIIFIVVYRNIVGLSFKEIFIFRKNDFAFVKSLGFGKK